MTDASTEAQWLAQMSAAAGYVVVFVLALFGGQGVTQSYDFACLAKPRKQHTLLVAEAKRYVGENFEGVKLRDDKR